MSNNTNVEQHFTVVHGVNRMNYERKIKEAIPENAQIINSIPQAALPNAVAIIYTVPEKKQVKIANPTRKPGTLKAPRKPTLQDRGFKVAQP
jgi:hypothetical protein